MIWYHTHRQAHTGHTGTNRQTQTYKYKFTPPVMSTQQLPVLHWMTNLLIQKFTFTMSLLFKNYSLAEVIYLLIRFSKNKSFLWNPKNADKNGVNEQNRNTTPRAKDNFWKRKLLLVNDTCFFRAIRQFYQPLLYHGKILNSQFWENFQSLTPLYKEGVPTMYIPKNMRKL